MKGTAIFFIVVFFCCLALSSTLHAAAVDVANGADVDWVEGTWPNFTGDDATGHFDTTADDQNFAGADIATPSASAGTINCWGTSEITDNIGNAGGTVERLAVLNIDTNAAGGKTVTLSGTYSFIVETNFAADSTLLLDTGHLLYGNVEGAGATDLRGTLTLNGGDNTMGGTVGTDATHRLKVINAGSTGSNDTFSGTVYAKTINITGTGAVEFNDVVGGDAGTLNFGDDGIVTIDESNNISSTITTTTGGTGTLTLEGSTNLTSTTGVGTDAKPLATINVNGTNASTVAFSGSAYATTLNFGGDANMTIAAGKTLDTTVTNTTTNNGYISFLGAGTSVGDIGSTGAGLRSLVVGNGAVTTDGDIKATILNFAGDNSLSIADGHNITGAVTTTAGAGTGTLTFDGATNTGGTIGTAALPLAAINFNGTTLLGHNIAATLTSINAGTTTCSGNNTVTGALTLANGAGLNLGTTTLTVNGVYTQAAGSTLTLTANSSTDFGNIASTEDAVVNAGSTVAVTVGGSIPNGTTLKVIDAKAGGAGVNVPTTITSSNSKYSFSGSSLDGDFILTVIRAADRLNFVSDATNSNSIAVAAVLDNITNPSADMTTVLDTLDLMTSTEVDQTLKTFVPVTDGGVTSVSNTSINQFTGTSMARLGEVFAQVHGAETGETGVSTGSKGSSGFEAWAQGFGEYAHQQPRGLSNGYCATVWGTAMGGDIPAFNDRVRLGLSGGYAASNINSKDNSGKTDINSYQGTLYAGYIDSANPYYLNGAFSFAYNTYKGSRRIAVGAIQRIADADYDGQQYSALIDGGYTFKTKNFRITPIASLQYLRLHLQSYTETGADALNLSVNSQNYDMLQSGLGMKFERPFKAKSYTVIPEVHARWLYDFIGDTQETTSTFSGGGGSFATQGFDPAQHSLNIGTKLTLATRGNWSLEANYDFEYKEDFRAHTGWANAKYKF